MTTTKERFLSVGCRTGGKIWVTIYLFSKDMVIYLGEFQYGSYDK